MNNRTFSLGAMIVGLFVGLLIGAGAMMMFAPKSGEEIRRDIAMKAQEVSTKAGETVSDLRNKAGETVEDLRNRAEDTAQDVRTRAQGTMQNN